MQDNPHIDKNGNKHWCNDQSERHRVDGPAVEWVDGYKAWYVDSKRHRIDGPAVEWPNGSREWWVDGHLHRIDGPAIEWVDGYRAWYIDGIKYDTEQEYWNKIKGLGLLIVDKPQKISRFKKLEIRR